MKRILINAGMMVLLAATSFALTATVGDYTYTYMLAEGKATICAGTTPQPAGDFEIPAFIDFYPVGVIGPEAFTNCTELTAISMPNTIIKIGNFAFFNCTNLKEITLSKGVRIIGNGAFAQCSALTSLYLPNYITSVGDFAFAQCKALTNITFTGNAPYAGENIFLGTSEKLKLSILPKSTGWVPFDATEQPPRWPIKDDDFNRRVLIVK